MVVFILSCMLLDSPASGIVQHFETYNQARERQEKYYNDNNDEHPDCDIKESYDEGSPATVVNEQPKDDNVDDKDKVSE